MQIMTGLCVPGDTPRALITDAYVVLSNVSWHPDQSARQRHWLSMQHAAEPRAQVTIMFQNAGIQAAQLPSGPLYLAQTVLAVALVGIELAEAAGRSAGAGLNENAAAGNGVTLLYSVRTSYTAASRDASIADAVRSAGQPVLSRAASRPAAPGVFPRKLVGACVLCAQAETHAGCSTELACTAGQLKRFQTTTSSSATSTQPWRCDTRCSSVLKTRHLQASRLPHTDRALFELQLQFADLLQPPGRSAALQHIVVPA